LLAREHDGKPECAGPAIIRPPSHARGLEQARSRYRYFPRSMPRWGVDGTQKAILTRSTSAGHFHPRRRSGSYTSDSGPALKQLSRGRLQGQAGNARLRQDHQPPQEG
jgi:hypothetical protein